MPPADAWGGGAERVALYAYLDPDDQLVVVEDAASAELCHLDPAAARLLGQHLQASDETTAVAGGVLVAIDDNGEELTLRSMTGTELGRLNWLDAAALAEELLTASRGEATGNDPALQTDLEVDLVVSLPTSGRNGTSTATEITLRHELLEQLDAALRTRGLGQVDGDGAGGGWQEIFLWVGSATWPAAWQVVRASLADRGLLHWASVTVSLGEGDERQLWPPHNHAPDLICGPARMARAGTVRPGGGRPWSARPWTHRAAPRPWHRRP
jgi:hypothetical protein